jgi:hypothetical protein
MSLPASTSTKYITGITRTSPIWNLTQIGQEIWTAVFHKFSTYQGAPSKFQAPQGDMKQVSHSGLRSFKLNSTKFSHPVFLNPWCKHGQKRLRLSSKVWLPLSRFSRYSGLLDIWKELLRKIVWKSENRVVVETTSWTEGWTCST